MKQIIRAIEDYDEEMGERLNKKDEIIRELQETVRDQGKIIEKLKNDMFQISCDADDMCW